MSSRVKSVLLRTALMVVAIFVIFAVLQGPVRHAEARAVVWLLHTLGSDRTGMAGPTTMYVVPHGKPSFLAVLTPACSSLASVLAMTGLTLLARTSTRGRRLAALGVAMAAIAGGNILRMAGSLAIGLFAGRTSLVLFHDSVGNVFSFAYTLAGYILLLFLLLPARGGADDAGAPRAELSIGGHARVPVAS